MGKSGLEVLYEDRLHETDGYKISILNEDGREKKVLAVKRERMGKIFIQRSMRDFRRKFMTNIKVIKAVL